MGDGDDLDASATPAASKIQRISDSFFENVLADVPPVWLKISFYLFLLLWISYIVYEASTYSRFNNYFFPMLVGFPVIILLLLNLIFVKYPGVVDRLTPQSQSGKEADMFADIEGMEESTRTKIEEYRYEIAMIGWIILLPVMNYFLGMGFSTLIYTFTLTYYLTRNLRTSIAVTLGVLIFVWILFIEILGMIIWEGTIPFPDPLRIMTDLISS